MKRIIAALATGAVVFAGVYGLAASIGVGTDTLGSGSTSVAACQAGPLTTSYATSYSSTLPGYQVGVVTVSGLDTTTEPTNCASKAFKITLVDSGDTALAEVTGTTPASGTTYPADFGPSDVLASSVAGVHVLITG